MCEATSQSLGPSPRHPDARSLFLSVAAEAAGAGVWAAEPSPAGLDALALARDAADLDTEVLRRLFHRAGTAAALAAAERLAPPGGGARHAAALLEARLPEVLEGFADGLERLARPEHFGGPW